MTNGTVAGTQELAGVAGAIFGLAPSDLIVYDGEVLFRGLDQLGRPPLWVTNGTATGTQMLTGIAGAATPTVGWTLPDSPFTAAWCCSMAPISAATTIVEDQWHGRGDNGDEPHRGDPVHKGYL